jgi:subtilisin family serine protease
MALIATGTAVISIGLCAAPASADQIRHQEWWLSSIGITGAWTASQGAHVTVAVLADGIDANQADLTSAVTTAPHLSAAPVAAGQYFGEQGTAIASLIAGRGHASGGGSGIVGIAPKAQILSVPVTLAADDPQLSEQSVAQTIPGAIAAGINYAVSHGATVIDLPLDPSQPGASGTAGATGLAGGSAAEKSAVQNALAHNVVLVAPAGDNGGTTADAPGYPAAYPGVIAVGAFNSAFDKAPWSSHQSYVTLTAPGQNVIAAASGGGYQALNSTSAASAIVAGIAALIRSRYPALTAAQVTTSMTSSTVYRPARGRTDGSGYGSVNADRAMAAAALLAAPASSRAGARAQPLVAPATVQGASATAGITHQIIRAAETSGALLLILLLLVAAYAATGRRRPGRSTAVATQWTPRPAQSRYPHAGPADPDRMLEFFAAPASEPERAGTATAVLPGRVIRDNDGVFAGSYGRPDVASTAGLPRPATLSPADHGRLLSPASRAVSRQPVVTGAPPWEPASAPDSELPWTAAPGRRPVAALPSAPAFASPASSPDWGANDDSVFRQTESPDEAGFDDSQPSWAQSSARPATPGGAAGFIAASRSGAAARHRRPGLAGVSESTAFAAGPDTGPRDQWQQARAEPFRDWEQPAQVLEQPAQVQNWEQPRQDWEQPAQDWEQPAQNWEQPAQDWEQPAQDWEQPAQNWPDPRPAPAPRPRPSWPDVPQEAPRTAASGLPVRTPRQPAAPLSPSGSLFDPVERTPGMFQDQADSAGSHSFYAWDRPGQDQTDSFPPLPGELGQDRPEWSPRGSGWGPPG